MPPERKWPWTWIKRDIAYIALMKRYENMNALDNKHLKEVWQEISKKTGMPANYCRRKWTAIKHNYLQLKYMIHNGRVTEDMARNHINTYKYLDGRLDFLDRYMFKIPEAKLSSSARNFCNSAFRPFLCQQSGGSSVEKLIKVKENNVIEVIKDYKQDSGTEPMSILPTIEVEASDSSITHFEEKNENLGMDPAIIEIYGINDDSESVGCVEPDILPNMQISTSANEEFVTYQALKEDYRIVDDLNNVQFVEPDMLSNIQIVQEDPIGGYVVPTTVTSSNLSKNILTLTKNADKKTSESTQVLSEVAIEDLKSQAKPQDLARFLVKYTNETMEDNCDLKEYLNDLAEVLCTRLAPGKRKNFLSQIDLLVSEILEGT